MLCIDCYCLAVEFIGAGPAFNFEHVEMARPFSFCKGHFQSKNLKVNGKLLKVTKANTSTLWPVGLKKSTTILCQHFFLLIYAFNS